MPSGGSAEDITSSIAESLLRKVALPANCLASLVELCDRPKKLHASMFDLLTKSEVRAMMPESLKSMTVAELKLKCLRKLENLTPEEIARMIQHGDSAEAAADNDQDDLIKSSSSMSLPPKPDHRGGDNEVKQNRPPCKTNSKTHGSTDDDWGGKQVPPKKDRNHETNKNSSELTRRGVQRSSIGGKTSSEGHTDKECHNTKRAKVKSTAPCPPKDDQQSDDDTSTPSSWASGAVGDERWSRSASPEHPSSETTRNKQRLSSTSDESASDSVGQRQSRRQSAAMADKANRNVRKRPHHRHDPDEDSSVESEIDSGVKSSKLSLGDAAAQPDQPAHSNNAAGSAATEAGGAPSHRLEEMGLAELEQRARALKALMAKLEKDKPEAAGKPEPAVQTDANDPIQDLELEITGSPKTKQDLDSKQGLNRPDGGKGKEVLKSSSTKGDRLRRHDERKDRKKSPSASRKRSRK